jgi:rubrerythrin
VKDFESVYREFVQFEERAAAIYLRLASRFSQELQISSFWLEMAMHEKQHASLVQICLCESLFAPDLPTATEIQKLAAFFEQLETRAADPNLTLQEGFALAIELEASEVNTIYCRLTEAVQDSMYLLRRKIATRFPEHIDTLIEGAKRFGVGENALQTLHDAARRARADIFQ